MASILLRRAMPDDNKAVVSLISRAGGASKFRKRYGAFKVELLDGSYLSMVAYDSQDPAVILAFAAFSDSPPGGATTEEWLAEFNALMGQQWRPHEVLFAEYLVADPAFELVAVEKLMTTVFNTLPTASYAVAPLPAREEPPTEMKELFRDLTLGFGTDGVDSMPGSKGPEKLLCCEREYVISSLGVRGACVEDHDDLVPVFDQQSQVLSKTYGDFFLAELIEAQDATNHALVGMAQGRAAGMMSVSSDVEVGLLQRCFRLEQYDYLVKTPAGWSFEAAREAAAEDGLQREPVEMDRVDMAVSVSVVGAPGSGHHGLARRVAERYGAVLVRPMQVLQDMAAEGSDTARTAKLFLDGGQPVPDKFVVELMLERLSQEDVAEQGVVLEDFPITAEQAEGLAKAGLMPQVLVSVEMGSVPGLVARAQAEKRDPDTGMIYSAAEATAMAARAASAAGGDVDVAAGMADGEAGEEKEDLEEGKDDMGDTVDVRRARDLGYIDPVDRFEPSEVAEVVQRLSPATEASEEELTAAVEAYLQQHRTFRIFWESFKGFNKEDGDNDNGNGEEETESKSKNSKSKNAAEEEGKAGDPGESTLDASEENLVAKAVSGLAWSKMSLDGDEDDLGATLTVFDALDNGPLPVPIIEPEALPQPEEQLAAMAPNAFAVTLFCLDGFFGSRARDFLPHAFARFPDRDYCVLSVPSSAPEPRHLVSDFTVATPLAGTTFSHVLYVLHRDALLADKHLSVQRFSRTLHGPRLQRLIGALGPAKGEAIGAMLDEENSLVAAEEEVPLGDNPSAAAFVACIGSEPVGLVVANRGVLSSERIVWLKANFDLDSFVNMDKHRARNQAVVTAAVLNPIFNGWSRFLLKEVMRLYGKSLLYYEADPLGGAAAAPPKLVLQHMVPVRPRRRVEEQSAGGTSYGGAAKPKEQYLMADSATPAGLGLHFLTHALLAEPRATVNTRVVVVGASATTAAFLEQLLFTPHLFFSNVTVVSPTGLPAPAASHDQQQTAGGPSSSSVVLVDEERPTAVEVACLGLPSRVCILETSLLDIDRGARALELPGDGVLPYDALVLTDELVDSCPSELCPSPEMLDTFAPEVANMLSQGEESGLVLGVEDELVEGVVSLSSTRADELVDEHLSAIPDSSGVVVYGASLEAMHAVSQLLRKGVQADRITWVRPAWGDAAGSSDAAPDASGAATLAPLGDPKAEAILSAAVAAAGVAERSDLLLRGVRGMAVDPLNDESASFGDNNDMMDAYGDGGGYGDGLMGAVPLEAIVFERVAPGSQQAEQANNNGNAAAGSFADSFQDPLEPVYENLPARLLLTFHDADVRPSLFQAINRSGLVYDGRLVVSPKMRTSDGAIFAGGDVTKFSRRFDATAHYHSFESPREVGSHLARCVVEALDPLGAGAGGFQGGDSAEGGGGGGGAEEAKYGGGVDEFGVGRGGGGLGGRAGEEPPVFLKPRTKCAHAPGGLFYCRAVAANCADPKVVKAEGLAGGEVVTVPDSNAAAKCLTTGALAMMDEQAGEGKEEEKAGSDARDRSCTLKLDGHGRICDLTYLGREPAEARNLRCLIGMQEAYANGCESAFNNDLVGDWVTFFRQDWARALYHDRFQDSFVPAMREKLGDDDGAKEIVALLGKALAAGKDDDAIATLRSNAVGVGGEKLMPGTRKLVETAMIEFLQENKAVLPQYLLPEKARKTPKE